MLDNLTNRLSGVIKNLRGNARLTETNIQDALREVRMALLEADVALPVVKAFISQIKERALGQEVMGSLTPGQALVGVVNAFQAAIGDPQRFSPASHIALGQLLLAARVLKVMRPSMRLSRKQRRSSRSCAKPTRYQLPAMYSRE